MVHSNDDNYDDDNLVVIKSLLCAVHPSSCFMYIHLSPNNPRYYY